MSIMPDLPVLDPGMYDPGDRLRNSGGRGAGIGRGGPGPGGGFYGSFAGSQLGQPAADPLASAWGRSRARFYPNAAATVLDNPTLGLRAPTNPVTGGAPADPAGVTATMLGKFGTMRGLGTGTWRPPTGRPSTPAPTPEPGTGTGTSWWDQAAGHTSDQGWAGGWWDLMGSAHDAGAFDPAGSDVIAKLIADTFNTRGALEDTGDVNELGALGMGDPSLYTAMLMGKRADRALTRDAAVAQARQGSAERVQDMMRQVFGSYLGAQNQNLLDMNATNWTRGPSGGNGGLWGDIIGTGISMLPMLFGKNPAPNGSGKNG